MCAHLHSKLKTQSWHHFLQSLPPWRVRLSGGFRLPSLLQQLTNHCHHLEKNPMFTAAKCINNFPERSLKFYIIFYITENLCVKWNQKEVLDFLYCSYALHVIVSVSWFPGSELPEGCSHWASYLLKWIDLKWHKYRPLGFFQMICLYDLLPDSVAESNNYYVLH